MITGMIRCLRTCNSLVGSGPSADRNEHAQSEQDCVAYSGPRFVEPKMDHRGRDHDDAQSNCGDGRQDGCDASGVRKHQTDDAEDS